MSSRPFVSVYNDEGKVVERRPLPAVFRSSIRQDIVSFVHTNIAKNARQAHGVDNKAGMKHSAESWGTGRAVARIPRVGGSGTHRSGQGAFGNMCRKGRMSHPLKTWRRWHRRVNLKQKRHAVESALAASSIVPLVLARGHRVQNVPELPLVVEDKIESYEKTKQALKFLRTLGAFDDVQKVIENTTLRAGQGKARNNRYKLRKGPLVVYSNENAKLRQAFRNVPGVEVCHVSRLNLLQLAPGGQLGRFIIWTAGAITQLNTIFNESNGKPAMRECVFNADISRIINSNQVQETLRPSKGHLNVRPAGQKRNPLTNSKAMDVLNPNAVLQRKAATLQNEERRKARQAQLQKKREPKKQTPEEKSRRKASRKWLTNVLKNLNASGKQDKQNEIDILRALQQACS